MSALSEYPALMEKAQEFSDKMKNAEGDMSASQWAKYNEITQKMLKAAQEMNE
jgi:deoxyadenosine/deoxycytidine kinase